MSRINSASGDPVLFLALATTLRVKAESVHGDDCLGRESTVRNLCYMHGLDGTTFQQSLCHRLPAIRPTVTRAGAHIISGAPSCANFRARCQTLLAYVVKQVIPTVWFCCRIKLRQPRAQRVEARGSFGRFAGPCEVWPRRGARCRARPRRRHEAAGPPSPIVRRRARSASMTDARRSSRASAAARQQFDQNAIGPLVRVSRGLAFHGRRIVQGSGSTSRVKHRGGAAEGDSLPLA
jgi:hypothetical protein